MRAKQLVPILADLFGVELETVNFIDRTLAQAGLRQKSHGRSWPEVTRQEALHLLLGLMSAQRVTTAAEDARRWSEALGASKRLTLPGRWLSRRSFLDRLDPVRTQHGMVRFIDYLLVLCSLIEEEGIDPEDVKVELIRSYGTAHVTFGNGDTPEDASDQFHVDGFANRHRFDSQIHTSVYVRGHALVEIIQRTEAPDVTEPENE